MADQVPWNARRAGAGAIAFLALVALAGGCESSEDVDKLCQAIGATAQAALQPRDRIFWDERCGPYQLRLLAQSRAAEDAATRARAAGLKIFSGPANGPQECQEAWDGARRECISYAARAAREEKGGARRPHPPRP